MEILSIVDVLLVALVFARKHVMLRGVFKFDCFELPLSPLDLHFFPLMLETRHTYGHCVVGLLSTVPSSYRPVS
jgi:hypothetical protein